MRSTSSRIFLTAALALAAQVAAPAAAGAQEGTGATGGVATTERQDSVWRDAWGQRKNLGLALGEAFVADLIPWAFNEYVPSRNEIKISQISPRSWWRNIEQGWNWDDNNFKTNHFAHPYQGHLYYTSARSNGYGYWTGLLFALGGSFHWECCGETHLMSINDWGNTSLGGAAVGEMLYRTSSMILDNQATGSGRTWREIGAGVLSPVRGVTRLVSGNSGRVYDNPTNANDWRPDFFEGVVMAGVRFSNSTREFPLGDLEDDTPTHGFLDLQWVYGSKTRLTRSTPFDYFKAEAKINLVKGRGLGVLRITGNVWHKNLTETENTTAALVAMQDFEYQNDIAVEQGGQSFRLQYVRERRLSNRGSLTWDAGISMTLMGGIRSELAALADVEGVREAYRNYDFGIGPGLAAGLEWRRDDRRVIDLSYRVQYLRTINGSNDAGDDSDHRIQNFRVQGIVPVYWKGYSAGVNFEGYRRTSNFDFRDIGEVKQHATAWEFFVVYNPRSRRN